MNDHRDATKAENPGLKIGEIAKLLGEKWANIEKEEKEKYEELAKEAKAKYEEAKKKYDAGEPAEEEEENKPPKEKKAKKEKKEKKGKKGKDPNAPKRPMGAYFLFMHDHRDATKAENPGLKIGEIAKLLGEKWANIEKEEKEKY